MKFLALSLANSQRPPTQPRHQGGTAPPPLSAPIFPKFSFFFGAMPCRARFSLSPRLRRAAFSIFNFHFDFPSGAALFAATSNQGKEGGGRNIESTPRTKKIKLAIERNAKLARRAPWGLCALRAVPSCRARHRRAPPPRRARSHIHRPHSRKTFTSLRRLKPNPPLFCTAINGQPHAPPPRESTKHQPRTRRD